MCASVCIHAFNGNAHPGLVLRWNCSRRFCSLQIPKVTFTLSGLPSLVGGGFGLRDYQHCPWATGAPVTISHGSGPLSSWLTRGEHENAAPLHLRRRYGLWDVSRSLGTRRGVGLRSTLHPCLDFALATCSPCSLKPALICKHVLNHLHANPHFRVSGCQTQNKLFFHVKIFLKSRNIL